MKCGFQCPESFHWHPLSPWGCALPWMLAMGPATCVQAILVGVYGRAHGCPGFGSFRAARLPRASYSKHILQKALAGACCWQARHAVLRWVCLAIRDCDFCGAWNSMLASISFQCPWWLALSSRRTTLAFVSTGAPAAGVLRFPGGAPGLPPFTAGTARLLESEAASVTSSELVPFGLSRASGMPVGAR